MTYLYVGIGLGLLCYAARWSRRRVDWLPASARDTGRRPRRRHRLGDSRRRRAALAQARRLVLALAYGRQNPFAHLVAGVVLEEGDVVFQQSTARLETWSTTSARVIDDHVSWGRRGEKPRSPIDGRLLARPRRVHLAAHVGPRCRPFRERWGAGIHLVGVGRGCRCRRQERICGA